MSEDRLKSIDQKLSVIINLLAQNVISNKSSGEAIEILINLGMNSIEIGKLTNKDPRNIRMQLSKRRKKGTKK